MKYPTKEQIGWLSTDDSQPRLHNPLQLPPTTVVYQICPACSASSSSISRQLSHSRMRECFEPACKHCRKTFDSTSNLHEHIRVDHGSEEAPTLGSTGLVHAERPSATPAKVLTACSIPTTPPMTALSFPTNPPASPRRTPPATPTAAWLAYPAPATTPCPRQILHYHLLRVLTDRQEHS